MRPCLSIVAGVADEDGHWVAGTTHLVQTGDFTDRGKDTRKVMDLLRRLQKEAKDAGGRAHVLLGNHEIMNILGDLRYVDPEEYESRIVGFFGSRVLARRTPPESGIRADQTIVRIDVHALTSGRMSRTVKRDR